MTISAQSALSGITRTEVTPYSLRNTITKMQNGNSNCFWSNDSAWVQYVKDHYSIIMQSVTEVPVDPDQIRRRGYSMEIYLDLIGKPSSMGWIVIWINQLETPMNFNFEVASLYIPDETVILTLYTQYKRSSSVSRQLGVLNLS